MQIPEVYLRQLNHKSVTLLTASLVTLQDDQDKDALLMSLRNGIRKTQVIQLLSEQMVVAISGLQGAGKSTLVKQLYDIGIDDYFPENLARGECLPVLIKEGESFRTEVCRFSFDQNGEFVWDDISAEEFKHATMSPGDNDLLLRLTVPRRYNFAEEFAFLLLPGFEPADCYWQELMRYSLMASMTCIFVFNQQKYPMRENKEALDTIRDSFKEALPIYVLTRSDQASDGNEALRTTVCKELCVEDGDRVICTGTYPDRDLKDTWIGELIGAIGKYAQTPPKFRSTQLASLRQLLTNDLSEVMMQFQLKAGELRLQHGDDTNKVTQMLEFFDAEVKRTKKAYLQVLQEALKLREDAAVSELKDEIRSKGQWKRLVERFKQAVMPQHPLNVEDEIKNIWSSCLQYSCDEEQLMVMNQLVNRRFQLYANLPTYENVKEDYSRGKLLQQSLQLIPRKDQSAEATAKTHHDLQLLFMPRKDGGFNDARGTLQHLPCLVMEYTRLGLALPEMLQTAPGQEAISKRLAPILKDFDFLNNQGAATVAGIAVMLGIDAEDGKVDTIPALAQAMGVSAAAAPIATAAAALIGATVMVSTVISHLLKSEIESDNAKRAMVRGMSDQLMAAYEERFDYLMDSVREVLEERLRDRYHLNASFNRVEAFYKALADVEECRKRLLEGIGPAMALVDAQP